MEGYQAQVCAEGGGVVLDEEDWHELLNIDQWSIFKLILGVRPGIYREYEAKVAVRSSTSGVCVDQTTTWPHKRHA